MCALTTRLQRPVA